MNIPNAILKSIDENLKIEFTPFKVSQLSYGDFHHPCHWSVSYHGKILCSHETEASARYRFQTLSRTLALMAAAGAIDSNEPISNSMLGKLWLREHDVSQMLANS